MKKMLLLAALGGAAACAAASAYAVQGTVPRLNAPHATNQNLVILNPGDVKTTRDVCKQRHGVVTKHGDGKWYCDLPPGQATPDQDSGDDE